MAARATTTRHGARTRGRLLAATSQLLRRQGYSATGLNRVVEESGAPKGSLYFHFPGGKEQLAEEAVGRSVDAVSGAIEQVLSRSEGLDAAIQAFGELLARNLEASGYRDGRPVATVTLEMAAESERIRAVCHAGFEGWLERVAAFMVERGAAERPARERASLLVCAFEGALILARARQDAGCLRETASQLRALPAPGAGA